MAGFRPGNIDGTQPLRRREWFCGNIPMTLIYHRVKKYDAILGYTGLRVAMGVAMLMHGVARAGHIPAFVESTVKTFASVLPDDAVRMFAWIVCPVEFLIGISVLFGLATRYGLLLGALWMSFLIFGSTLIENYNVVGTQLIYSVIFFLLLVNARYNAVSLDTLFSKKGFTKPE
jgi:thiosulfate dehydrogenase [quinone] large subunit